MEVAQTESVFAMQSLKKALLAAVRYLPSAPADKPNGLVETAA